MINIFNQECKKYWKKDLTVCQIVPNTKRGLEGWNNHIDQLPSQKTKDKWKANDSPNGIGLLTGKKVTEDKIIIGIDVDLEEYVGPVERIIGPYPSAKKGAKGITIFALTDANVRKMSIPKKGRRAIDVLSRSISVLPPTIHPDTGQPYQWIGEPLYEIDIMALPYISENDLRLISAIIENDNHRVLMDGESTHEAALSLAASLVHISSDDEKIIHYLSAFFDSSYNGNTIQELPEMLRSARDKGFDIKAEDDGGKSPAVIMIELFENQGHALFHDYFMKPYMVYKENEIETVYPLRGSVATRLLQRMFYNEHKRPLSSQSFKTALEILEAKALFESPQESVYLRVAPDNQDVILNLSNSDCEVVVINKEGYVIASASPVRFVSSPAMLPLAKPQKGNENILFEFQDLLGLEDDVFARVLAFLINCLNPHGPYLCMMIEGEQGSGKSFLTECCKKLLDDSKAAKIRLPNQERDLMIQAKDNGIMLFDNVSTIKPDISDALCVLSTGGGFSTRRLYTDDELVIFTETRPFILNGISAFATRPDLLERSVSIHLKSMPTEKRKSEAELRDGFEKLRPALLDKLCNIVSCALRNFEDVTTPTTIRMADAARWLVAAEPETGLPEGTLLRVLEQGQKDMVMASLARNSLAVAIIEMAEKSSFYGTMGDLLSLLQGQEKEQGRYDRFFPTTSSALSKSLDRLKPGLKTAGVIIQEGEKTRVGKLVKVFLDTDAEPSSLCDPTSSGPIEI